MATKDGGPAFPGIEIWREETIHHGGMSLRDWFAGQALSGLLTKDRGYHAVAAIAYDYADAMLKARGQ